MVSRPWLPPERLLASAIWGARVLPRVARRLGLVASVMTMVAVVSDAQAASASLVAMGDAALVSRGQMDPDAGAWAPAPSDAGAHADSAPRTDADRGRGPEANRGSNDAGAPDSPEPAPPPVPPTDLPSARPGAPLVVVEGLVLGKGTRQPLAGSTLLLDGHDAGETDAEGRFRLMLKPGGQKLLIQHPGFVHFTAALKGPGGPEPLVFRLMPMLSGQRYITEVHTRPAAPSVHVEGEEAREVPGSSGDPFRVLGTLPGVSQVAWPAAVYVVRGANPGNTGFFVDGIRVPALFHLGLGPSIIHPYLIEGLDFYPGAYPAAYGRYVSGIVAARTSVPPADRVHASVDVTVFDAGGVVTAPIDQGRGTISVAGRYSYTGAVLSLVQSNTKLGYADYQLRVDDRVAGGALTLFALGSWDEVGWAANMAQEGVLQFHRLDLRYSHAVAGGRALVGVTFGHDRAQSTLFYSPINVKSYEVAPRFSFERAFGSFAELKLGGDAEAQTFRTTKPDFQGMQSDLTRPRAALQLGGYASLLLKLGAALRVVPGVHVDNFLEEQWRRRVVQPRLSAFLNLNEGLVLEGAVGRFAQMPSLPVSVPGFESFGLKSLGLQTSDAASLGLQATGLGWHTSMTGFFQRMRLSDITNIEIEGMNPTRENYLEMRDGTSYGVETLVRKRNEGRAYGWLAYTLSWSRHAVHGVVGPSDFDQRHVLNVVGGYRLDHGLTVGGRLHLHTGRYAPIFGKPTQETPDTYRRLPTYAQLDLRVARHFVFDRLLMDLFLDLGNVAFQKEVIEWARDPATGQVEQRTLHIILPTIGVHIVY